jgi:phytanoyl-CoA hydroxylase
MADVQNIPEVTDFPGELSDDHLAQYQEHGYLAFENVLTDGEVEDARAALTEVTINLMKMAKRGEAKIRQRDDATQNYAGVQVIKPDTGFGIHFEAGLDPLELAPEEAELKFRKLHGYHQEHPAFIKLSLDHPNIIGTIRQVIGEEVVLKGAMALSKPPFIGSEKPWHQDNAYFNWLPLGKVATAWIALDDATVENGCMHVIPGGHTLGALKHYHTIDCEILPDRIDRTQAVPLPMKAGGVMFFSAMLPHQTPPNQTSGRRRALQLQYRGVSTVEVSKEEFGKVFAEADGTPASCALAHENG